MPKHYSDELKRFVETLRDEGRTSREICEAVWRNFPQVKGFSQKSAKRVGMRYAARKEEPQPERKTTPKAPPPTVCQYVTLSSWPGTCGAEGYPYCQHHRQAISSNEGYAPSWPQFKSYNF